jgi:hypothetical protein
MAILPTEEYVEQAYLFRALSERINRNEPIQSLLKNLRAEVLATTNLPKAIAFILDELNHAGTISTAMRRLAHYFAPFQAYLMEESENERGRFDSLAAFTILQHEAQCRADQVSPQAMFFFQFEVLCRNRLNYDRGLAAMSLDPIFDRVWARWILDVRHKLGIVDLVDLVYVHSQHYVNSRRRVTDTDPEHDTEIPAAVLFGEKEGRIALANRKSEPLYFFAALQRQLKYPPVPRPAPRDDAQETLKKVQRVLERLEVRVKLLEDEQRDAGIDLSKFYLRPDAPGAIPAPPADGE